MTSASGSRTVPAGEFFVSYLATAVAANELLVEVRFPVSRLRTGYAFTEFARRHGDFALVGVAAVVEREDNGRCRDVRLAFTGIGPVPLLFTDESGRLRGEPLTPRAIANFAGAAAAELEPDSDLHASAEYRRELAAVLAGRAIGAAASRAAESR